MSNDVNNIYEEKFMEDPDQVERILLYSNGIDQEKLLGVKPIHKEFITGAKKWYKGLKDVLERKEGGGSEIARDNLESIYKRLIKGY